MKKLFFLLFAFAVLFGDVYVGIPGGYKDVFTKLIEKYNATHSEKVEAIYGPMGVLMAQAKMNTLDVILGDKEKLTKNGFKGFNKLGYGKLVILTKKKIKSVNEIDSLKRLAEPKPKSTTYGKAAWEAFKNLNLHPNILTVSLMPQGINYLKMGECDGAVANKTQEILLKNKFYALEIPQKYYSPILIGYCVLHNKKGVKEFVDFLNSKKDYLQRFGI
jgi:molybdate transport system substrate-binding protein